MGRLCRELYTVTIIMMSAVVKSMKLLRAGTGKRITHSNLKKNIFVFLGPKSFWNQGIKLPHPIDVLTICFECERYFESRKQKKAERNGIAGEGGGKVRQKLFK